MKDLPPHNSKTSSGPTPPRRGGERYSGLCASRSRAKKSLRTRLLLRGFWAKKKRLAALPKRLKTFKLKGMRLSTIAVVMFLLLAAPVFADETATSTAPDPNAEVQAQIDATNAEIQKLKNEIAALQTNLNLTTAQKQTLQTAIKALDLQIQKLQKSVTLTSGQISVKDKEIGNLSGKIRTTEEKISDSRVAVASTLRQLERMDQEYLAVALLGGGTLSRFFDQAITVGSLRGELQNKIQDLGSLRDNLESSKQSDEHKRKELAALKANLNHQKQGVAAAKADQATLLVQTKNKESEYQKLIAKKIAEQEKFEQDLRSFESQLGLSVTAGSFPAASQGILEWPLDSVRITQYFGNTDFSTKNPQIYSGRGHTGMAF